MGMKGNGCVAIASDKRFGIQLQTIGLDFDKIFEVGPKIYMGIPGLATDTQTVNQRMKFRTNLYELKENRPVSPKVLSAMISNLLYEHRFAIKQYARNSVLKNNNGRYKHQPNVLS